MLTVTQLNYSNLFQGEAGNISVTISTPEDISDLSEVVLKFESEIAVSP